MKRFTRFLLFLTALVSSVACGELYGIIKDISVEATTSGFVSEGEKTPASWGSGEKIQLFSEAATTPAVFTLKSGAGSATATFEGTINTQPSYIGVRPAESLKLANGQEISFSTDKVAVDFNIEKLAAATPQLGEGGGSNINFAPIFGAVEIPISLSQSTDVSVIKVSVPLNCGRLTGMYTYELASGKITSLSGANEASIVLDTPVTIGETQTPLYVALPQGQYTYVKVSVAEGSGAYTVFTVKDITVNQGAITKAGTPTISQTPLVVGNWQLITYCGVAAEVELYLSLLENNTFTLYQRSGDADFVTFTGTWAYDAETKTLSGVYSDNTKWASSYFVNLDKSGLLYLTNSTNADEVSVYQVATSLPTKSTAASRSTFVKPLL